MTVRRLNVLVAGSVSAAALVGGQAVAAPGPGPSVVQAIQSVQAVQSGRPSTRGLEADGQRRPLAVDNPHPRLAWRMLGGHRGVRQAAYAVQVTDLGAHPGGRDKTVWRTGKVRTSRPWAEYAGAPLKPLHRYSWTVRIWDERGARSKRARSWFETGFMRAETWKADWIQGPPPPEDCEDARRCSPAPLLRTSFRVGSKPVKARLYASGLGYSTYRLNGRRVSRDVLSPGFTEYTERAFYVAYDVTRALRRGANALGAQLGRGPFGSSGSNFAGYNSAPWHADPQLRLELHIDLANGKHRVIRSTPRWRTASGPTLYDDYMLGETFDARRAVQLRGWDRHRYRASGWSRARPARGPKGSLTSQVEEPIRPQRTLAFKKVSKTSAGTYLFDLGTEITGNAILRGRVKPGQELTLHYGEKLDSNGSVDTSGGSFDGSVMQLDTYIGKKGRDLWRPEFTYKGFRYVEVAGLRATPPLSLLRAQEWGMAWKDTGRWSSSNQLLNRILDASRLSIEMNSMSIPMDTPIYEKTGYTADGQLVADAASYLVDTRRFYQKWLVDIAQSVAPNGDMGISAPLPSDPADPQVAPFGFTGASPGWDAALFVVPDVLDRFYGDSRPGLGALPAMRRALSYYETRQSGDIIPATCTVVLIQECKDGLGDWTAPAGMSYGAAVDSTAWWYWMLTQLEDWNRRAGDDGQASAVRERAARVQAAFNSAFYDPVRQQYIDYLNPHPADGTRPGLPSTFSQHQNAMALGLGLVPPDRAGVIGGAIADDVDARSGHLSTGIMGTRFLFHSLSQTGHLDAALRVLDQTTYPSYGFWLDELGYSSLGEFWEAGQRSYSHQMYGSVVQFLFEQLAGYRPADGFRRITIAPQIPPSGLSHVSASTMTEAGKVAVAWERRGDGVVVHIEVPANAEAAVTLPGSPASIRETATGRRLPLEQTPGLSEVSSRGASSVFTAGAGSYTFHTTLR